MSLDIRFDKSHLKDRHKIQRILRITRISNHLKKEQVYTPKLDTQKDKESVEAENVAKEKSLNNCTKNLTISGQYSGLDEAIDIHNSQVKLSKGFRQIIGPLKAKHAYKK